MHKNAVCQQQQQETYSSDVCSVHAVVCTVMPMMFNSSKMTLPRPAVRY